MRSAVYNLFTTLLLLVPISAVPLMAIFGIPQFTPVVAFPLDEQAEEDEWKNAAPRRPKSPMKTPHADDAEIDLTLDESPNWDDETTERSRPIRKIKRSPEQTTGRQFPDNSAAELAHSPPPVGKKRPATPPRDASDDDVIQKASYQTVQAPLRLDVVEEPASGIQDLFGNDGSAEPDPLPAVPSYRRQRAVSSTEDGTSERSSARNKKQPPAEPLTWTTAVRRLNEMGIRNFRLEPGVRPGEFSFTCSYTPSNSPHVTRRFEAEADDPLKAVEKVLAQVDEAAQQRAVAAPQRLTNSGDRRGRE